MTLRDEPAKVGDRRRDVILVGSGARARAWADVLGQAAALSVVARVARRPEALPPSATPVFSSLHEALEAFPHARVASTLPPRSGLQLVRSLLHARREGVVEAPLDDGLASLELPAGAAGIQVAHGFVTLSSVRWMTQALGRRTTDRARVEVRGLPEAERGELADVLAHALPLVLRLFPGATVVRAKCPTEAQAEVELDAHTGASIHLLATAQGRGLEVTSSGPGGAFGLRAHGEGEDEVVWSADGGELRRERIVRSPAAAVRALAQLLDGRGDDLLAAQRAARLAREVRRALGRRSIPTSRAMRAAATAAPTLAPLERFGLIGVLPAARPAPVTRLPLAVEPLELWPFRAGCKPVAFVTTRPSDAERVAAYFGDVHVERRMRRVSIGPQDAWVDRRDEGNEAVELYLSRDRDLAREAARLQAEGDPSRSLSALGRLMGYPACCIDAFAAQTDRSNNVRNRYQTFSRTTAPGPWPWLLNNLTTMLVPCFPCAYDCEAALELARATVTEMDRAHPGIAGGLATVLGRPVLYFDQDDAITLEGRVEGDEVRYHGATVSEAASSDVVALAGVICEGDTLRWAHDHLLVRASGREIARLERTDPGLGFLAPFGPD